MNNWISDTSISPRFILALGDNFYPSGVSSTKDPAWKTIWEKPFLQYPALKVPWRIVLGNHDYMTNPDAQIEFTNSPNNPEGIWSLPNRVYKFTESINGSTECKVDFFAMDTNGAQYHVRRDYKKLNMQNELWKYKQWLIEELGQSKAHWKIVFAHHPLYTKGTEHGIIAKCLREDLYKHRTGESKGYDLEKVLLQGGVQLYLSGHEHVLQHKIAKGINYAVVFSGSDTGFYGEEDTSVEMNWFKEIPGFLVVTVTTEEINLKYVGDGSVIFHSVSIKKDKLL